MPLAALTAAFGAAIVFIVATTAAGRLHAFFALIVAATGYGLLAGMGPAYVARSLGDGSAAGFVDVGLFVLTGVIVGRILTASGGLSTLAEVVRWRTRRRWLKPTIAVGGLLFGIGVSVEAAFVLLLPLTAAVARVAAACRRSLGLLLALTLGAGHCLLLPAPGPVIATTVLAADPALVLLFGIIAATAAGVAALLFIAVAGRLFWATDDFEPPVPPAEAIVPSAGRFRSGLPIAVPLLLLGIATLGHFASEPLGGGGNRQLLLSAGAAPTVLIVAVGLAVWSAAGLRQRIIGETGWITQAITEAAPLILITSAAIALERVLQNSGLPDLAADATLRFVFAGSSPLLIAGAFAVAAVLKTAQGSSLVAMISAAGIVEPWITANDLALRSIAVVAVGAGATVVSHANDGVFWIVVRWLGLKPGRGYLTQTLGSFIAGAGALAAVLTLATVLC